MIALVPGRASGVQSLTTGIINTASATGGDLADWFVSSQPTWCTRVLPVASLFGINRLREVAQEIETDQIQDELAIVRTWHNDYHNGSLKTDNETTREQQYNQDFFMKILGYAEKPASPYTFGPKVTTLKRQQPDAVIGYGNTVTGITNPAAVIELKGANIRLDRPQQREGNMSPVQQGFKYKTQYQTCPFVIVSNFWEFRLYNNNQLDFERWNLDDLANPVDDYLKFKTWYVLLRAENMVAVSGKSSTELLLSDIRKQQEEIGQKFYSDYQRARTELLKDIWTNNKSTRFQFNIAIEKAQTIIDRIVFACFAEDRGLLPDNTVARVVKYADESPIDEPLFVQLKAFFTAIDIGSARLGIPMGYNGGLFREDPWINALRISDEPLRMLTDLGRYDFNEDLSVNILGHIFERSITDLEEIRRSVPVNVGFETPTFQAPPQTGRRKKEGIYYTPDHIVRYIVNETVGSHLRQHEEALKTKNNLRGMRTEKGYNEREERAYLEYQRVLQRIRVLDPACGSGAFLVGAFDYLLAENRRVAEILSVHTEGKALSILSDEDFIRNILSDNLFGVDLNEESVEITRLSLWLKTAEKGKPLMSLDTTVKCGNTLIHDASVVGNKAFNWSSLDIPADPDVKQSGRIGFDVVLGNPPYVDSESMVVNNPEERVWIAGNYDCAAGNWDLFVPFVEKGLSLLSDSPLAVFGFIMPNKVLGADYASKLRIHIDTKFALREIVDVSREKVFADADVYPVILAIGKNNTGDAARQVLVTRSLDPRIQEAVEYKAAYTSNWTEYLATQRALLAKLAKVGKLGESLTVHASTTVNEAYLLIEEITDSTQVCQGQLKFINTGTVDRYTNNWGITPTRYIKNAYQNPLVNRDDCPNKPWLAHPRIILAGMSAIVEAFPDPDKQYFAGVSTVVVTTDNVDELYYAVAILNSSVISAYFCEMYNGEAMAGGYINVKPGGIRDLPFVKFDAASVAHERLVAASRSLTAAHQSKHEFAAASNKFLFDMYGTKPDRNGDLVGLGFDKLRKRIGKLTLIQANELHDWFLMKDAVRVVLGNAVDAGEKQVSDLVNKIFGVDGWLPQA